MNLDYSQFDLKKWHYFLCLFDIGQLCQHKVKSVIEVYQGFSVEVNYEDDDLFWPRVIKEKNLYSELISDWDNFNTIQICTFFELRPSFEFIRRLALSWVYCPPHFNLEYHKTRSFGKEELVRIDVLEPRKPSKHKTDTWTVTESYQHDKKSVLIHIEVFLAYILTKALYRIHETISNELSYLPRGTILRCFMYPSIAAIFFMALISQYTSVILIIMGPVCVVWSAWLCCRDSIFRNYLKEERWGDNEPKRLELAGVSLLEWVFRRILNDSKYVAMLGSRYIPEEANAGEFEQGLSKLYLAKQERYEHLHRLQILDGIILAALSAVMLAIVSLTELLR